jgi:hypothetical protein
MRKKGTGHKPKLGTPATAARVFSLINSKREQADAQIELLEWCDELMSREGVNYSRERAVFTSMFLKAARRSERDGDKLNAYREIQRILARVESGETLTEVINAREAERERQRVKMRHEAFTAPEPKDTTSDEWRYWKIRQIGRALDEGGEARSRAMSEVRALLRGLAGSPDFWHVDNVKRLLPDLIIARQEIDQLDKPPRRARRGGRADE